MVVVAEPPTTKGEEAMEVTFSVSAVTLVAFTFVEETVVTEMVEGRDQVSVAGAEDAMVIWFVVPRKVKVGPLAPLMVVVAEPELHAVVESVPDELTTTHGEPVAPSTGIRTDEEELFGTIVVPWNFHGFSGVRFWALIDAEIEIPATITAIIMLRLRLCIKV